MGLLQRSPWPLSRPPELRPPRSMWWWALPAALLVGATVWGISAWLLQDLHTVPVAEQVSARIETVRTALAAGAGVGAAVTLLLAVRRQQHLELSAAHTTHDAAERRVTELYTRPPSSSATPRPRSGWPGCTRWSAWPKTPRRCARPSWMCFART